MVWQLEKAILVVIVLCFLLYTNHFFLESTHSCLPHPPSPLPQIPLPLHSPSAEVSKLRAEMDARRSSISVPEEAHKLIILRSFMETMCATLAQEGNSGDRSPRDLNEQQLCAALKGHIERLLLGESAAVVASPSKRYLEDALRYAQSLSET